MRIPLLLALEERGFKVAAAGSEKSDPFDDAGIPYYRYLLSRWINPIADQRSIAQLARLFTTHRPDVIHSFDTKPSLLMPFAARRAGVHATLRTITGMGYLFSVDNLLTYSLRPVYLFLQRRASGLACATVFQNRDDREYFLSRGMLGAGQAELVQGSGIDLRMFSDTVDEGSKGATLRKDLGLREGELVVILVARLLRTKGIIEYCDAAKRISKISGKIKFLLVGPLASEGRYAVTRDELDSYRDVVDVLGVRSDVKELLSVADIFVLPTYYREGLPRALLEAAAMGLPLITTAMPGCKDIVLDGVNGYLIPPRDTDSLVEAISKLSSDSEIRKSMANNSIEHAQQFSLDKVADAYAAIYRRLLSVKANYEH